MISNDKSCQRAHGWAAAATVGLGERFGGRGLGGGVGKHKTER